jgi:hypothetical protein
MSDTENGVKIQGGIWCIVNDIYTEKNSDNLHLFITYEKIMCQKHDIDKIRPFSFVPCKDIESS